MELFQRVWGFLGMPRKSTEYGVTAISHGILKFFRIPWRFRQGQWRFHAISNKPLNSLVASSFMDLKTCNSIGPPFWPWNVQWNSMEVWNMDINISYDTGMAFCCMCHVCFMLSRGYMSGDPCVIKIFEYWFKAYFLYAWFRVTSNAPSKNGGMLKILYSCINMICWITKLFLNCYMYPLWCHKQHKRWKPFTESWNWLSICSCHVWAHEIEKTSVH